MSLSGNIKDVPVLDVMQLVHVGKRTGTLFIENQDKQVTIAFKSGQITSAWGTGRSRLSEILSSTQTVSASQLEEAQRAQDRDLAPRTLESLLIGSGALTAERLRSAVLAHVSGIVREVAVLDRGTFEFTQEAPLSLVAAGSVASREALDSIPEVSLDTEFVLLEALRLLDESAGIPRRPELGLDNMSLPPLPVGSHRPRVSMLAPRPLEPAAAMNKMASLPPMAPDPAPEEPDAAWTPTPIAPLTVEEVAAGDEDPQIELLINLVDAERRADQLAKLYQAAYELHASLNPVDVEAAIKGIAVRLLGAKKFVLLLRDEQGGIGHDVILTEGLDPKGTAFGGGMYLGGEAIIDAALADGIPRLAAPSAPGLRAVIPLLVQGETMGALAILEVSPGRRPLGDDDRELLRLIALHAASALLAARIYSRTDRKLRTLEALMALIRSDPTGRVDLAALEPDPIRLGSKS